MSWLDYLTGPWRSAALVTDIHTRIKRLELHMADISPVLNQLADDLAAWGAGPFSEMVAESQRNAARVAELEAQAAGREVEETSESTAAQRAVDEFNRIVRPVSEAPEVPVEIPPVQVPETPVDGATPAS